LKILSIIVIFTAKIINYSGLKMKFSVIINLTAILLLFTVIGGCQEKEVIIQETYHKNGAVESQIPIVNGKRDGMQKFFYEDGKLASQVLYVQDLKQGQFKAWFHDGKLKLVANYRDSKLQGEATTYYENGKIMLKERYEKGRLTYQKKYSYEGRVEYEDEY